MDQKVFNITNILAMCTLHVIFHTHTLALKTVGYTIQHIINTVEVTSCSHFLCRLHHETF